MIGTARTTRASPALRPGWQPVDGRTPRQLLADSVRTAALFNFFDEQDRPSGNWSAFFSEVPLVRYAILAEIDVARQERLFRDWLRSLNLDPEIRKIGDQAASWSLIDRLLELYRQVDRDARFFSDQPAEATFAGTLRQAIAGALRTDCDAVLRCRAWLEEHREYPFELPGWPANRATWDTLELNPEWWHIPALSADEPRAFDGPEFVTALTRAAWSTQATVVQLVEAAANGFEQRYAAPSGLPPHFAIYLAFIRQFSGSQAALNDVPARHCEYFYRRVLELRPAAALPDTALVAFTPAPDGWTELEAGTELTAGKDSAGQPIVYRTTATLALTPSSLARFSTLYRSRWSPQATGFYVATAANSLDGAGSPLPPGQSWATFGEDQRGLAPAARTMADASVGFAITSPVLHLAGGIRRITVTIGFSPLPPGDPPPMLSASISPVWQIDYSGETGWVPVVATPPPMCVLRYAEGSGALTPIDLTVDFTLPISAPPCVNYNPSKLGPGYDARVPVLRIRYPNPAEAFPGIDDGMAAAFTTARVKTARVDVTVSQLQALTFIGPTGTLVAGKPLPLFGAPPQPAAQFLIGSVELFRKQPDTLTVTLDWLGLPIDPPGTPADQLQFKNGLADYYRAYLPAFTTPPTNAFCNDRYCVFLSALMGRAWPRIDTAQPQTAPAGEFLFAWTGNTSTVPPATVSSGELAAASTWSADPAALRASWSPTFDFAGASDFSPATPTGFLGLTLNAPDYLFGQALYPAAVAKIALDNALTIVATSQPKPPPTPSTISPNAAYNKIRSKPLPQSWLGRVQAAFRLAPAPRYTFTPKLLPAVQNAGKFPLEVLGFINAAHLLPDETFNKLVALMDPATPVTFTDRASFQSTIATGLGLSAGTPENESARDEIIGWLACLLYDPPPAPPPSLQPPPPPPLVPTAANVQIGYTAHATIDFPAPDGSTASPAWDRLWQISPLAVYPAAAGASLLPATSPGGCLYLGFIDVQPSELLSLLFVLKEVPAQSIPPAGDAPQWQWLIGDTWQDAGTSVHDSTEGFLRSGIVRIELPSAIDTTHTVMPAGFVWLSVQVTSPQARLRTIQALPHGTTVAWSPPPASTPEAIEAHFAQPLPAGSITGLAVANPAIAKVLQPLPGTYGTAPETRAAFDTRASERLRHKGRAVAGRDYERLILQQFPSIFFARAVTPSSPASAGMVTLVVLPTVSTPPLASPPGLSPGDLVAIEKAIGSLAPLSAAINVINPTYETVLVTVQVSFAGDHSPDFYRRQLTRDLQAFISPWIYDQANVTDPVNAFHVSDLREFVACRPYVREVGTCEAKVVSSASQTLPSGASGWIAPSSPTGLLVSAADHQILPMP